MKDIRKETTIFDEIDIENITEEEFEKMSEKIIEQNDIDYRAIQTGAFEQLGLKKKKRFFRKGLTIGLIAAAIGISAIGVGVVASGSFKNVFNGFMGGDTPDGIGTGSDFSVSCENNNVELNGLCGNGTSVYAVYTIEKKDGTDFVKDYKNTITAYERNIYETIPDADGPEMNPTYYYMDDKKAIWATKGGLLTGTEELPAVSGTFEYRFESNSELKVFANCHSLTDDLKGNTLHLRDFTINAYTPVEYIYRSPNVTKDGKEMCSDIIEGLKKEYPDLYKSFDSMHRYFNSEKTASGEGGEFPEKETEEAYEFIRKIRQAYKPLLKENQVIMMDEIFKGFMICEKNVLDLNYEISVRMDYNTTTRSFDIDSSKEFVYTPDPDTVDAAIAMNPHYDPSEFRRDPVKFTVESMEADSFSIRIKTHSEAATEYRSLLYDSLYDSALVELKDGTKYKTMNYGFSSQDTDNSNTDDYFQFFYASTDGLSDDELMFARQAGIDPNEIKAVYLGTTVIYSEE